MKIIEAKQYTYVAVLGEEIPTPDKAWLDYQFFAPTVNGKWYRAYPLDGGAIIINEHDFDVLREATEEDFNELYDGHDFNPAAEAVRELRAKVTNAKNNRIGLPSR